MREGRLEPKLRFPEFEGNWLYTALGNIARIYDGTHQTPKYVSKGVPFVSVENIQDIESTDKYITGKAFETGFKIKPKKDDILMTRITAGIIGATAIVPNNNPLGYYVSLALIRKFNDHITISFLNHRINTHLFKKELHKRIIHIAFPKKINLGDIGFCKISYPQRDEQQKIASFLTSVDKRIELLAQKKEKLEQYKKAVMQKIFNRDIRFKDENGNDFPEWGEKKIGEICIKSSSNLSANSLDNNVGNYKIYGATGYLQNVDFYQEESPYIAIIKDGAGVGRTFVCDPYSSVLATLDKIIVKENNDLYFLYLILNQINFEKYITGSTIPHIYFKDYSNEKMKVPTYNEQKLITSFLSAIDKQIETVVNQIDSMKTWKKGLLQQMFV